MNWIGAIVLLWIACLTRSNALLYNGYILLYGLGCTFVRIQNLLQESCKITTTDIKRTTSSSRSNQQSTTSDSNDSSTNQQQQQQQNGRQQLQPKQQWAITKLVSAFSPIILCCIISIGMYYASMGYHNAKANRYFCEYLVNNNSNTSNSTSIDDLTAYFGITDDTIDNNNQLATPDWCDNFISYNDYYDRNHYLLLLFRNNNTIVTTPSPPSSNIVISMLGQLQEQFQTVWSKIQYHFQFYRYNLYSHIQRKHWNVGLFRYWTIQQIPNFLLAGPILIISFLAVFQWIQSSWEQYKFQQLIRTKKNKKNGTHTRSLIRSHTVRDVIKFSFDVIFRAITALQNFVTDPPTTYIRKNDNAPIRVDDNEDGHDNTKPKAPTIPTNTTSKLSNHQSSVSNEVMKNDSSKMDIDADTMAIRILTGSPQLLGHYAVLAATAILGLLIAHVQISTRMICSSCPALYWYITAQLINDQNETSKLTRSDYIVVWFVLYIVLSIVLHPNWLPWT
jgi:hypothetical protein